VDSTHHHVYTGQDPQPQTVTPPVARALSDRLPEAVAAAVIEFLTTVLVEQPHRVGKPLRGQLEGVFSARRGTYRVLYEIVEEPRQVAVDRIEHRRDAYRDL
jgi:mRNA interferase RelE/StbE